MKTTKLLALLLAFLLLLTACGTDKTNSAASSSETESPLTDPPKTNAPETKPPEIQNPEVFMEPYDGYYYVEDRFQDLEILEKIVRSHGRDSDELRAQFIKYYNNDYLSQNPPKLLLPKLYLYLKWYNANFETITKEKFAQFNHHNKHGYDETDIDLLFSFDDERISKEFTSPMAFIIDGRPRDTYKLMISIVQGNDRSFALRIRESQELKDFVEVFEKYKEKCDEVTRLNAQRLISHLDSLGLYYGDGTLSNYGKEWFFSSRETLSGSTESRIMTIVSSNQGYSIEEQDAFSLRFWGNETCDPNGPAAEWEMIDGLPLLYQYVKWYSSAVQPVTKEELKAASDSLKELWPDYCLTEAQIDVLVSLDDEAVLAAFANPAALVFDGEIYPLSKLISVDGEVVKPIIKDATRKIIGTDELKKYIETIRNFGFDTEDTEKYVEALTELYNYSE